MDLDSECLLLCLYRHMSCDPFLYGNWVSPIYCLCVWQSLNMYVPPDEAVQDLGEIDMTFTQDHPVDAHHIGASAGVDAAINPIFQP